MTYLTKIATENRPSDLPLRVLKQFVPLSTLKCVIAEGILRPLTPEACIWILCPFLTLKAFFRLLGYG